MFSLSRRDRHEGSGEAVEDDRLSMTLVGG